MEADLTCDVAVIGSGTAGLAAERSARSAGAQTLLIDPVFDGTTCANVGCMPSKLLIAAAAVAYSASHAAAFGISAQPNIDGVAVMRRVRKERDHFVEATRAGIKALPDKTLICAKAQFAAPTSLILDDGQCVSAKAIIIATGSAPMIPAMFSAISHLILTNETVFELETLPRSLAVIGAGPLGLELAQAMARLGVSVTVLDQGTQIGGVDDDRIADQIKTLLGREFDIHLGVELEATFTDGMAHLRWSGAKIGEGNFERVLVAAGRPPSLQGLGLERTGLTLDENGVPDFDPATMRCGESAIYIAGDADAFRPVLHEASFEGAIAGANAARHPYAERVERPAPFSIMFTDPPLCVIGRQAGDDLVVGEAEYGDQGRARIEDRAGGLARLYADRGDGCLRGGMLFCPGADHLGHLLAWSIEGRATADGLLNRPFYHPTLEEGLKPALRSICKQVGLASPGGRDEGAPAGA